MKISKAKTLLVLAAAVAGMTSFTLPAHAFFGMGGLLGTGIGAGWGGYGYPYGYGAGYGGYYGGYASNVNYDLGLGGAYVSPVGFDAGLGCGACGSLGLPAYDWDQPYEFFRH